MAIIISKISTRMIMFASIKSLLLPLRPTGIKEDREGRTAYPWGWITPQSEL